MSKWFGLIEDELIDTLQVPLSIADKFRGRCFSRDPEFKIVPVMPAKPSTAVRKYSRKTASHLSLSALFTVIARTAWGVVHLDPSLGARTQLFQLCLHCIAVLWRADSQLVPFSFVSSLCAFVCLLGSASRFCHSESFLPVVLDFVKSSLKTLFLDSQRLANVASALVAEDRARNAASFAAWCALHAKLRGAAALHRYSRAHLTIMSAQSVLASPLSESEALQDEWVDVWEKNQGPEPDFSSLPDIPELPRPSLLSLRSLLLRYSWRVGLGGDFIRPRNLFQLSDAALECMISICMKVERQRRWPSQLLLVLFVQVPKGSGIGHRVIGLLTMVYRVWMRLRSGLLSDWEASIVSEVDFLAKSGCGALDAVYDQALEDELCVAQGRLTACSVADLSKFYEMIPLGALLHACRNLSGGSKYCSEFPLLVAVLCILMYRSDRRLVCYGSCSSGVRTTQAVIAGCTGATTLIKAYYLVPLSVYAERWPFIRIKVYLDDFLSRWRGRRSEDIGELIDCTTGLCSLLADDLLCPLGKGPKAPFIVCSHPDVIAAGLPLATSAGFNWQREGVWLGCDFKLPLVRRSASS